MVFEKAKRLTALMRSPFFPGRAKPEARWADAVEDPKTFDLERHADHELALDLLDLLADDPGSVKVLAAFIVARTWPLRHRAARALIAQGSRPAKRMLAMDTGKSVLGYLVVHTLLHVDPVRAFEQLQPYLDPHAWRNPGDDLVASLTLGALQPMSERVRRNLSVPPAPIPPEHPGWAPWIQWCVSVRNHPFFSAAAVKILRACPEEVVNAALQGQLRTEADRVTRQRPAGSPDFVSQYAAGRHNEVWEALRAFEAIDGDLYEEALEVSRATMRIVAANLDRLADRLRALGWRGLHVPELRAPPGGESLEQLQRLEAALGHRIPPTLYAFYEVAGAVDFVWDYRSDQPAPDLGLGLAPQHLDPLAVWPLPADEADEMLELYEDGAHGDLREPMRFTFAPDSHMKAKFSGAQGPTILLPCPQADPLVVFENNAAPLLDYLRGAITCGGMIGLRSARPTRAIRRFGKQMTSDIEPF